METDNSQRDDELKNYYHQDNQTDEAFLKIWASVIEKRESIKEQSEENEKKLNFERLETSRLIEESGKKVLDVLNEKNRQITEKSIDPEDRFWKRFFSFINDFLK